ncbi:MAG TPA: ATP-binding protein [Edaphobacter sp.]|nr:ATP-binding protein [Edaphobacter sp.]
MNSLRARLILIFLAATLAPLGATWWITTSLLERSLAYSSTDQLDRVSRTLELAGREFYQESRETLKHDVEAHRENGRAWSRSAQASWPEQVRAFWESGDAERFDLSDDGKTLLYLVRRPGSVQAYERALGVDMARIGNEYRQARETVERSKELDLRRGFVSTFVLLAAAVWACSLALLILMAYRISRPIRQLTEGLDRLASGDESVRLVNERQDEIGRAIRAFNGMAAQLAENRERLVYLTQLASWQLLARKMAHELKNSLTPIRLTMEEVIARNAGAGDAFIDQAARIVVDESESLERRIRAFSQFAAEPPVEARPVPVNAAIGERIGFLRSGHPEVRYETALAVELPGAMADPDLLNGILTNLLENAAEAAGAGGSVLVTTARAEDGRVAIEVHDSGPGLSQEARRSLFEPTISFKKRGMGLGLSIARKNALLMGGDITLVDGNLGGAAFRVLLRAAPDSDSSVISSSTERVSVSPQPRTTLCPDD